MRRILLSTILVVVTSLPEGALAQSVITAELAPQKKLRVAMNADNQEQAVRDLEIDPALFTPKDQIRPWVREWPQDVEPDKLMPQPVRRSQAQKK